MSAREIGQGEAENKGLKKYDVRGESEATARPRMWESKTACSGKKTSGERLGRRRLRATNLVNLTGTALVSGVKIRRLSWLAAKTSTAAYLNMLRPTAYPPRAPLEATFMSVSFLMLDREAPRKEVSPSRVNRLRRRRSP